MSNSFTENTRRGTGQQTDRRKEKGKNCVKVRKHRIELTLEMLKIQ